VNKVVLSGGVFQNKLLLRISLDLLYKAGFQVFAHRALLTNDAGISLGQAVIAGLRG
jgi:hydrogenase maturation protein HypF